MGSSQSGRVLLRLLLVLVLLGGLVLLGLALFRTGPPPKVAIESAMKGIGKRTPVTVTASAQGRGLAGVKVELVQGDRVELLRSVDHASPPAWKVWESGVAQEVIPLEVGRDTVKGLKPGEATIRVTAARAGSWIRSPQPVVEELTLPVRLAPPSVGVVSTATYAAQGGCEAVVYRVGETSVRDGVQAGEWFFRGWPLPGGGPQDRFAFFAVPYDMSDPSQVVLVASDEVGNEARTTFIDQFFPRPPTSDRIELSDAFLAKVVPEIMSHTPELEDRGDPLQNYLQINRDLRKANAEELVRLAASSKPEFLWRTTFQAMPNSAMMAQFADRRTYLWDGKEVDRQVHLGYDLAATRAVPVPAANDGVVVMAKYFGIYGNTVVVDHGYGLQSLYGHLSAIDVKEGDAVTRGQVLGRTGATGLAFGDHLHFTLLLQGLPVHPREWLDGHWIQDRIARKLGGAFRFEG